MLLVSAYYVRACKIKHFTEREFSGIFFGGGEFCVFKTGIPGGPGVALFSEKKLTTVLFITVTFIDFTRVSPRTSFICPT